MNLFYTIYTLLPSANSATNMRVVKTAWARRHVKDLSDCEDTVVMVVASLGMRMEVVRLVARGRRVSVRAKLATNIRDRRRAEPCQY